MKKRNKNLDQRANLRARAQRQDQDIDTSDIPEIRDLGKAETERLYPPNKLMEILLRRSNKILLVEPEIKSTGVPKSLIATFNLNIQDLGYTVSAGAIKTLQKHGATSLFENVLNVLTKLRGVKNYKPMYPNFPAQVMEASDAELYLNAVLHYFSFVVADAAHDSSIIWLPKYRKEAREPLDEKVQLTILDFGDVEDLRVMANRIATSNTSLSETDKEDLRFLVKNGYLTAINTIPNKENLAVVGATLLSEKLQFGLISEQFKTATDVLRLATALSDGDISLAADTKFKSFPRLIRRILIQLLDGAENREEDMLRFRNRWINLAHALHVAEYHNRYPKACASVTKLRIAKSTSKNKIATFNSKVEKTIRAGEIRKAVSLLVLRSGDFSRRLDHLLRTDINQAEHTINSFEEVAAEVSTPVLLQVMAHFKGRNQSDMRVAFPKGQLAKVKVITTNRATLSSTLSTSVADVCSQTLVNRFSKLPKLGKIYIDPKLKGYLLPFSQRSASKSLRTLVRGSQIPFAENKNTIRFFTWWKNTRNTETSESDAWSSDGRVDLDLSAVIYNENWQCIQEIAFYNLRADYGTFNGFKAYHSGDITGAPQGACELIDVDIPSAMKFGARYVVMDVRSYTGQNLSEIPECSAGWMLREKNQSGEIFEPKTVIDKIDIACKAQQVMPLVIDLVERKIIWMDIVTKNNHVYNTARGNIAQIALLTKAMTQIRKPNLHELISMHAEGRGKIVQSPDKADVVFSVEAGTPFELEKIASEFMANALSVKSKAAQK